MRVEAKLFQWERLACREFVFDASKGPVPESSLGGGGGRPAYVYPAGLVDAKISSPKLATHSPEAPQP